MLEAPLISSRRLTPLHAIAVVSFWYDKVILPQAYACSASGAMLEWSQKQVYTRDFEGKCLNFTSHVQSNFSSPSPLTALLASRFLASLSSTAKGAPIVKDAMTDLTGVPSLSTQEKQNWYIIPHLIGMQAMGTALRTNDTLLMRNIVTSAFSGGIAHGGVIHALVNSRDPVRRVQSLCMPDDRPALCYHGVGHGFLHVLLIRRFNLSYSHCSPLPRVPISNKIVNAGLLWCATLPHPRGFECADGVYETVLQLSGSLNHSWPWLFCERQELFIAACYYRFKEYFMQGHPFRPDLLNPTILPPPCASYVQHERQVKCELGTDRGCMHRMAFAGLQFARFHLPPVCPRWNNVSNAEILL